VKNRMPGNRHVRDCGGWGWKHPHLPGAEQDGDDSAGSSGMRRHSAAIQPLEMWRLQTRRPFSPQDLFRFTALGEPGAARAVCTPSTQTVSTAVTGEVRRDRNGLDSFQASIVRLYGLIGKVFESPYDLSY
jgi:hypothetical protein